MAKNSLVNGCKRFLVVALILLLATTLQMQQSPADLKLKARQALEKATHFYRSEVAVHGGYVYYYSPTGDDRHGEGPATETQIWVQPPGTPTVGRAFLAAYEATAAPKFLQAALDAGQALVYGQLKSGAWTNSIDFDPNGKTAAYRNGRGVGRNFSSLDDGISQTAIQFLMRLDEATKFRNSEIHAATATALEALLDAQFTNGAFPQGWDENSNRERPVVLASFPDYDWKTEGRIKNYWDMATLNDGMAGTISETLILAHNVYEVDLPESRRTYLPRLHKFGRFLVAAQLPEPQPGWAQQYNDQGQPIWARRFEPPAVAGRETQDVIQALIKIADATNEASFLKPIPAALQWLQRSKLSDGRLARYYELKTNQPLYMTRSGKQYSLTYDDRQLPKHYGWKVQSRLPELQNSYRDVLNGKPASQATKLNLSSIRKIINELDAKGRWISTYSGERLTGQPKFQIGQPYLSSQVFSDRIQMLAAFLSAP